MPRLRVGKKGVNTVRKVQGEIDACTRPQTEQVIAADMKRLIMHHQNALLHCIKGIDEHLLRCRNHVDEYKKACSVLVGVNERLAEMGEETLELPMHVLCENPLDLIMARVEGLQVRGKI